MVTQKTTTNAEQGASAGMELTEEAQRLQGTIDRFGALLGIAVSSKD
jgi:hypothetical protein